MLNVYQITKSIKEKAKQIGFDLVSISPVVDFPENQYYKEWLSKGYAGEMSYLSRNSDKRVEINKVLPGAKSIICCGLNYNTDLPYSAELSNKNRGWISRYAWADDYHDTLGEMLKQLTEYLDTIITEPYSSKYYVDTGPVLEKVVSKYAGIGWIGKNTCLINQDLGSWLFLGEIILDLELEYDSTVPDRCGSCTKCIESCPTDAIVDPYVLDAKKCISYLTIELKGVIPGDFRESMENIIYGCDICQDVCPWNKKALVTDNKHFMPRDNLFNPLLSEIAELTFEEFNKTFKNSPIKRTKRKGMLRNIMIAIGNSSNRQLLPYVISALSNDEPVVRASAVWAYWKLCRDDVMDELRCLLEIENDPLVREEILNILN
jgi:epoxyqueuosine reductase